MRRRRGERRGAAAREAAAVQLRAVLRANRVAYLGSCTSASMRSCRCAASRRPACTHTQPGVACPGSHFVTKGCLFRLPLCSSAPSCMCAHAGRSCRSRRVMVGVPIENPQSWRNKTLLHVAAVAGCHGIVMRPVQQLSCMHRTRGWWKGRGQAAASTLNGIR